VAVGNGIRTMVGQALFLFFSLRALAGWRGCYATSRASRPSRQPGQNLTREGAGHRYAGSAWSISGQGVRDLRRYLREPFDRVVTVCDDVSRGVPGLPGARERAHWSLPDPSAAIGTADEEACGLPGQ